MTTTPFHEGDHERAEVEAPPAPLDPAAELPSSFFRSDRLRSFVADYGMAPGTQVGDFRLIRLIGQGGMGQVWQAEDIKLRRTVALKFVLPERVDEKSLALFSREARAGGRLQHKNIVTTLTFGSDDDRSWIAQELIEGSWTLKDFLEELRGGGSTPKGYYRLVAEFVAQVADGLQAAHDSGVIHRDIKPQNILITPDDTPKLTDFGLARVADDSVQSQTGDFAGTWAYMSPEQVTAKRMGLDHRTDVFSLGIVLYEMLTLRRPFDGETTHQIAEQIITVDPPDASKLRSQCPRDLAVICSKALEKAPAQRYATAAELAADLRRHLAGEPILAKPSGILSRCAKWVLRHRAVSASTGVGMVALAIILSLAVHNARISSENSELRTQLKRANALQHEGDLIGARTLQEAALSDLERRLPPGDPRLWRPRLDLAASKFELGDLAGARAIQESVIESMQRELPPDHPDLWPARVELAATLRKLGDVRRSQALYASVLKSMQSLLPADHPDLLAASSNLAYSMLDSGDLAGARELQESVVAALERILPPTHADLERARLDLASTLVALGDPAAARALQAPIVAAMEQRLPPRNPKLLRAQSNLAISQSLLGNAGEARELQESVLAAREATLPADHPATLAAKSNLAVTLRGMGELDAAQALQQSVVETLAQALPADHPDLLTARADLALSAFVEDRDWVFGASADALISTRLGPSGLVSGAVTSPPMSLFVSEQEAAQLEAARDLRQALLPILEQILGTEDPRITRLRAQLADAHFRLGDLAEASRLQARVVRGFERALGPEHPESKTARLRLELIGEMQNR